MSFFNAAVFEDYLVQENKDAATTSPDAPTQEQARDYQIHVTARRSHKDDHERVELPAEQNTVKVNTAS